MEEIDLAENFEDLIKAAGKEAQPEQAEKAEEEQSFEQSDQASADFESQMRELERIVGKLESGKLNLQESIDYFEKGHAISQNCHKILEQMEERIKVLDLNNPAIDKELDI